MAPGCLGRTRKIKFYLYGVVVWQYDVYVLQKQMFIRRTLKLYGRMCDGGDAQNPDGCWYGGMSGKGRVSAVLYNF